MHCSINFIPLLLGFPRDYFRKRTSLILSRSVVITVFRGGGLSSYVWGHHSCILLLMIYGLILVSLRKTRERERERGKWNLKNLRVIWEGKGGWLQVLSCPRSGCGSPLPRFLPSLGQRYSFHYILLGEFVADDSQLRFWRDLPGPRSHVFWGVHIYGLVSVAM